MRKIRNQLLCLLCLISFANQAQNTDKKKIIDLLKKSVALYEKTDSYSMESSFKLFVNYTSNEVKENYTGLSVKKGNTSYTKIASTEMINLNKLFIKIDNQNKRIKISKIKELDKQSNPADFSSYINYFSGFTIVDTESQWVCTLSTSKVSMIPYSKIVVYINKSNNQIVKQEMFFLSKYKTKIVNGVPKFETPRLQIVFTNFKTSGFKTQNYFNSENYIKLNKGKYYPVKEYKAYTIVD